jgi:tRNA dimethylallyltransferase
MSTSKKKDRVIFIVGPTAVGKTGFAVSLAKKIGGEVVSADSMQIYKGMRTLSQAPAGAEKSGVRHHLVERLGPNEEYSVAIFIKEASARIASIIKRGKTPIVAGGSGLYVKGLIDGLFPSPEADLRFREKLARIAKKSGSGKLHLCLAKIDPAAAEKIHPNDLRRIIRALEIYESTGKTMTELKASTRGLKDHFRIKIFGLTRPREELYARINDRVEKMFKHRAVAEVKKLRRRKLSRTAAMALGLPEISGYLDGLYGRQAAIDMLKLNTRRFSKRQMTWFRADKRIRWIDLSGLSKREAIEKVSRLAV